MSHYVSYFCVGVTKRPDRNNLRRELFVVVAVVVAHRLRRFSSLLFRPRRLNRTLWLWEFLVDGSCSCSRGPGSKGSRQEVTKDTIP